MENEEDYFLRTLIIIFGLPVLFCIYMIISILALGIESDFGTKEIIVSKAITEQSTLEKFIYDYNGGNYKVPNEKVWLLMKENRKYQCHIVKCGSKYTIFTEYKIDSAEEELE